MNTLPIDEVLPELRLAISQSENIILQAPPGAGKTTKVPLALMQIIEKEILVLEPRRLAARVSAEFVAQSLGEVVGKTVGYQYRYENMTGPDTKIKYVTEGLLVRFLQSDPKLSRVGCVILDEFHERHTHTDMAISIIKNLQSTIRPDLRLIVMSATLETKLVENYLPLARVIKSEGRAFPVEIEYLKETELQKPLEILVELSLEKLITQKKSSGHTLVFLPGAREINRTLQHLRNLGWLKEFKVCKLSADLSQGEQKEVFAHSSQRKVILSTNVAETSVTIDGVDAVIDSGLARTAGHNAWTGVPTLKLTEVSRASCDQRAGRAGRTSPGKVKRLYSSYNYQSRLAFETPELKRVDLMGPILNNLIVYRNLNQSEMSAYLIPWFDAPPSDLIKSAVEKLMLIDCLKVDGTISDTGIKVAQHPLHPRLGRILVEAEKLGQLPLSVWLVSLISENGILKYDAEASHESQSDIHFQLELLLLTDRSSSIQLDHLRADRVKRQAQQIQKFLNLQSLKVDKINDKSLTQLLFSAYPDRAGHIKSFRTGEVNFCQGGGALLSKKSALHDGSFLIAIDVEELERRQSHYQATIKMAHPIEKEDFALGGSLLNETKNYEWNAETQQVYLSLRTCYGGIVLDEHKKFIIDTDVESVLAQKLVAFWPKPFDDETDFIFLKERCRLAQELGLNIEFPTFDEEFFDIFSQFICENKNSFAKIREKSLETYLEEFIGYEIIQPLNRFAPKAFSIGAGRSVKVHYEPGKQPSVQSFLQDFFGTTKTPRICDGKLALTVHLLAPNRRAVQVTDDLESFWKSGYKEVKQQLSRKYPRHSWPDDPVSACPPEIKKRRERS